jgi:four helix bundle protein
VHKITSFRDLLIWQRSMDLAVRCHAAVRAFPISEQMVLGHQIRKSAISVPSNIAEGFSRHSKASYIHHLWIAHASSAELETQIEIAMRTKLIATCDGEMIVSSAQETGRMINGLVRSLVR